MTLILKIQTAPKGGKLAALALGLGFLDLALRLTQRSTIREMTWVLVRRCSPFTNRERKKTRHSKSRKCRSTFSSTPNERVFSGMLLKSMLLVNNTSTFFAILATRALVGRNTPIAQSVVGLADATTTSLLSIMMTSLLLLLLIMLVLLALERARFY